MCELAIVMDWKPTPSISQPPTREKDPGAWTAPKGRENPPDWGFRMPSAGVREYSFVAQKEEETTSAFESRMRESARIFLKERADLER